MARTKAPKPKVVFATDEWCEQSLGTKLEIMFKDGEHEEEKPVLTDYITLTRIHGVAADDDGEELPYKLTVIDTLGGGDDDGEEEEDGE